MKASIDFTGFVRGIIRARCAATIAHGCDGSMTARRGRDRGIGGAPLRPELVRAGDVRVIRLELGVEPARRSSRASGAMRRPIDSAQSCPWQRLVPMPVRRSMTSCSETASSSCTAWCSWATMSGFDGTQPLGAARHLAGQLDHPPVAAAVRGDRASRACRAPSPRRRHLARDVEPGARLDATRLLVDAVERQRARVRLGARAAERRASPRSPSSSARLRKHVSLVPVIDRKRPPRLGDDLVRARDVRLALALLRTRAAARPRTCRRPRRARRAGRAPPARTSPEQVVDLVARSRAADRGRRRSRCRSCPPARTRATG